MQWRREPTDPNKIRELYLKRQLSATSIAKDLGMSKARLLKLLRDEGIAIRPAGRRKTHD